ncbi:MAG: xanthine dehydrogenase family protein subunit M [Calditrichaeota bacterium]|nr:MAG: xanthine dehydrogenase family protein subunit M [Calditrichota bacterium]
MKPFEYAIPETLQETFDFLAAPQSELKAGGIDLIDLMKEGLAQPRRLVNIRGLQELHFVKGDAATGLRLGPNLTLAEVAGHAALRESYRALAQAADAAATPQIRHVATLGGNLCQRPRCWYFRSSAFPCARKGGDQCYAVDGENQYHAIFGNDSGCVIVHPSATAVALMALGARLKIASAKAERELAIDAFFVSPETDITRENVLKPEEVITEVMLPPAARGFTSFYFKQKEKQAFDWPIAEVAVALTLAGGVCKDAKVVLGAAAPIPWRVPRAEALLKNQPISVKLAKQAAQEALKDANPLSENAYKVPVFKAAIYRTICRAAGIDPFA